MVLWGLATYTGVFIIEGVHVFLTHSVYIVLPLIVLPDIQAVEELVKGYQPPDVMVPSLPWPSGQDPFVVVF